MYYNLQLYDDDDHAIFVNINSTANVEHTVSQQQDKLHI